MQIDYSKNPTKQFLMMAIIAIGIIILTATFLGKEVAKPVTDFTYISVSGILVMLSSKMVLRFKKNGSHGKAWLFFLGFSICWFIAETTWSIYELVYNINPFPSLADVFYLSGYPFLFCFLMYYLKPVRLAITRKMIVGAVILSVALTIPSIYMTYNFDPKVQILENVIATTYPISDAIVFIPAIIGVVLFFRGEVNFTWSLICLGIVLAAIGDTGFQIAEFTDTYYTGHPADIVLLWAYVFFSFGVYDHVLLFKKQKIDRISKLKK